MFTEAGPCTKAWGNTELQILKVRVRPYQHSCSLQMTNSVFVTLLLLPKEELHRQTAFSPPLTYLHVFLMCLATTATAWLLRATRTYTKESRPHSHVDSTPRAACNSLKKVKISPPIHMGFKQIYQNTQ